MDLTINTSMPGMLKLKYWERSHPSSKENAGEHIEKVNFQCCTQNWHCGVNLFLSAHLKYSGTKDQKENSKEKCDEEKSGYKDLARLFASSSWLLALWLRVFQVRIALFFTKTVERTRTFNEESSNASIIKGLINMGRTVWTLYGITSTSQVVGWLSQK